MPKGGKYLALTRYLKQCGKDHLTLSFQEIEKIIGCDLPPFAHKHVAYWANSRTHSVAFGWLDAGFQTQEKDLEKRLITFGN